VLLGIFSLEFIGVASFNRVFSFVQEFIELGPELVSRYDTTFVSFLSNANFTCNFESCFLVITRDDPYVCPCVVEFFNRLDNTLSHRINKTNSSNKSELGLND
jgi:hypothetical protein